MDQRQYVQETTTAFSRLMIDDKRTNNNNIDITSNHRKSVQSLLSNIINFSTVNAHQQLSSKTITSSSPSILDATETVKRQQQSPSLLSQPTMSIPPIPTATMGVEPVPSCNSLDTAQGSGSTVTIVSQTSLSPLVERDLLSSSSSNVTLVPDMAIAKTKLRPLSSMECAESWLPTVTLTTSIPQTLSINGNQNNNVYNRVASISTNRQSIHPLELEPSFDATTSTITEQNHKSRLLTNPLPLFTESMQQAQSQSVITKKTSIAAKLRKVFISRQQQSLFVTKGLETREGIVSLSSSLKDEANGSSGNSGTLTSTQFATGKHRGSTSSNSSADTALGNRSGNLPFRRCSGQTATPLTSPENSPPNSPTIKVSPSLMIVAAAVHDQAESPSSIFNPSFLTLEAEGSSDAASASISALGHSDLHDKSTLRSLSSKSIKRRLSFASISSFFGSRNNNTPQESRAKQHRSFSVPHVENPLTVGRQIAGFQRRHSLNDLHDHSNGKLPLSVHHHVVSPLSSEEAQNTSVITSATNRGPSKKLSFNNMFSKQKKKSIRPSKLAPSASAKPLKSALVHRSPGTANDQSKAHLVHSNAYRRSSSVRSQSSSYCQQYRHYPHYNQHHHQCPSQHALSTTDSLTHLAEANHSLASLSRRSSIQEDDGHDIYQQSYNYLPCSPTVACNSCTSRLSLEGPNDGILGTMATNIMNVVTANALSTPTPRILPTITIETGLNNDIAYEAQYCSLPQHLSPILSRSSSCRSFSSSSESVGEAHQSSSSSSSSSSISGSGSCSSSSCSIHFEINHTLAPTHKSGQLRVNGSSCRRPSDNQTFNPLLPAFAARVSVDHIALDSHQSNSITTEAPSIAYESPSTISNSSTEDSSASSTCTNVTLLPLANSIGYQKRDLVPLQHLGGYHDLQCQQEATVCLLYDQNEYEDERAYEHGHEHEHEQQYHHYAIDHDEYEQRRHLIEYQRQQHQYHHLHHLDLHHQEQHCYVDWASIYPPRPPRQLQFSTEGPTVFPTWTPEQYDRTSDTSTTASRLTPATAQRIKLELNQFKRHEMEVHQDSQIYTHYFL